MSRRRRRRGRRKCKTTQERIIRKGGRERKEMKGIKFEGRGEREAPPQGRKNVEVGVGGGGRGTSSHTRQCKVNTSSSPP